LHARGIRTIKPTAMHMMAEGHRHVAQQLAASIR
jgi:hypothetical protein